MASSDNASTAETFAADNAKKARIEIIPLIDVIFFLLATFVLFTLSLNKSGGIPVKLPATETSEARDANNAVTISITPEGTIAWDKDLLTLDEFIIRLQAYKQIEPNPRILVNGDEGAMFSHMRYVVDEIRKSGISKVHIETRIASAR
jgi:biopolymer transport protein ExbD